MKLIYEVLEIEDFKSIKKLRFDFRLRNGLYFVSGRNDTEPELESNGAGKSTIFDALCWIQFGTTPKGLRGPDLIPWGTNDAPSGKLTILIDGRRHVLSRSSKPGRILLDNKDITQESLEATLRIGIDTYCHTVLLPQEYKLFFDLTAGEKLGLLSTTLGLDRWDERSEKAASKAREEESEIIKMQSRISSLQRSKQELDQTYTALKRQSDDWEEAQAAKQKVSDKELKELERLLAKAQSAKNDADLAYDSAVTELNAIRRELHQLADYIRSNDIEIARCEGDIKTAKRECESIRQSIKLLQKGKCSTCGQSLHGKVPKRDELEKALLEAEARTNPGALQPFQTANADLLSRQTNIRAAEQTLTKKAETARTTLDFQLPKVAELQAKLTMVRKQQKESEQITNPFRSQLKQLRQRQDRIESDLEKEQKSCKIHEQQQERLEFWSRAFRDIKLEIIAEVLQELEMCVNTMLPQVGLIGWMIEFGIERETKKGSIARGIDLKILPYKRTSDQRVKFASWSGGEARRLRLVGATALGDVLLRRAGVDIPLQILDEPTRSLNPKGVVYMVDFLAERADDLGRIILLADQTVIQSDSFSGVITVKRTKNGTQVLQ